MVSSSSSSWLGLGLLGLSTQQRSDLLGQLAFSRTSSQMRLAMAWMHLPGQVSESAVWVMVPRRPETWKENHANVVQYT